MWQICHAIERERKKINVFNEYVKNKNVQI